MTQSKFNTEYSTHIGLLHKFSKGGYARLRNCGINVDYEDVYQEACLSYVKARNAYDPSTGVGFGAYMGRSVINNFNKQADRLLKRGLPINIQYLEDIDESNMRLEDDLLECISTKDEMGLVEAVDSATHLIEMFSSPRDAKIKAVLEDFFDPSSEVIAKHAADLAHYEFAMSVNEACPRVPETIDLHYLAGYHGIRYFKFTKALKEKAGIKL